MCEREQETERMCVCVREREIGRGGVCACVCERENERARERERERDLRLLARLPGWSVLGLALSARSLTPRRGHASKRCSHLLATKKNGTMAKVDDVGAEVVYMVCLWGASGGARRATTTTARHRVHHRGRKTMLTHGLPAPLEWSANPRIVP